MVIDKSLFTAAAGAIAAVVGYKVIKKMNPKLVKLTKKTFKEVKKETKKIVDEAKSTIKDGISKI